MEWFQPQPASIASLAECMFSLVFTLYLLSIPRKSKDGWLITVHYGLFTALYTAAFLSTASQSAPWHEKAEGGQFVILAFNTTYNLWFAYAFRQNPFRSESQWVVAGVGGLYACAIIAGKAAIVWTFPLFLFAPLWVVITFVRKAMRAFHAEPGSSNRLLIGQLLNPVKGEGRVYRDFAACYLVYFLVSVDASLGNLGLISSWWYLHVQLLIFLFLTLEMLTYVKHAQEPTTFLVKLVGVFLCLTMVLLGLMGFLLYGTGPSGRGDQQELYTLTLLIPIATGIIVLGAPAFFRSNLLRPLRQVVEGVERVDRGDLTVQLPVAARDELGTLANSFNRMTASLRKYADQMDQLVQERTVELEHKSHALLQQQEELHLTLEKLKAAQTQLLSASAQKTRFFDNITHEFRTPLTLILTPVERLLSQYEKEPGRRRDLEIVDRNARQLLHLINQLLDLARLEADHVSVDNKPGDLASCIADIVHIFLPEAESRKIKLSYESGVQGDYVFDAQKLQQIGYNLLANALKFTPEGGQVAVSLQPAPADETGLIGEKKIGVTLQVSDTGMGIPTDSLPYIFNRFYQAPSLTAFWHPGTGIGLSLVKELTQLLGGKVTVESQVGLGTTFTVTMPLLTVEGASIPEPMPLLGGRSSLDLSFPSAAFSQELYPPSEAPLLLVVEDNTELKEFMAGELAGQYRVLSASNGREGMEVALRELPDVVISDVMMPEMDGYALCQSIKTTPQTSHIALILLTARASHERMMEGLTYGADEYLTKPFHLEELGLRLRNLLDRQAKLRAFYGRQLEHLDQSDGGPAQPAAQDAFLQRIQAIMERHLDNPALGPELLAREVGMTPRNLSRKLNALAGTSPARMIRIFRLQRAARLLQSRHSVAEAAYATGFESPSYFATAFKEQYGLTPSEFASASPLPDPSVKNV